MWPNRREEPTHGENEEKRVIGENARSREGKVEGKEGRKDLEDIKVVYFLIWIFFFLLLLSGRLVGRCCRRVRSLRANAACKWKEATTWARPNHLAFNRRHGR